MKTLNIFLRLSVFALIYSVLIFCPRAVFAQGSTGTIQGHLKDQNGNPVFGNTYMYVVHPGTGGFYNADFYNLASGLNQDGAFMISNLTPGNYIIGACTQGYICGYYGNTRFIAEATVVSLSAGETVDIYMTLDTSGSYSGNPGTIQGHLYDKFGNPVHGGSVTAVPTGSQGSPYTSWINDDNSFSIDNLIPGSYLIEGGTDGYAYGFYGGTRYFANATIVSVYPGETIRNIDFSLLDLAGTISGRVFDQNNNPLTGEYILVSSYDDRYPLGYTGVTDSNGYYQMVGAPTGDYRVCV